MTHVSTIPANQLYWAVLDTSALPTRQRRDPRRLGYLFEGSLPQPVESIHAAYRRVDSTRTLAVGIDREALSAFCSQSNAAVVIPDSTPEYLTDHADITPSLNLRTGVFEHPKVRLLKRISMWTGLLGVAVSVMLVGFGFRARSGAHAIATEQLQAYRDTQIDAVLPPSDQDRRPGAVRLLSETRALRQAARTSAESVDYADDVLADVLISWPKDVNVQTNRISANGGLLTIEAEVGSAEDAETLANALTPSEGWIADQPRVVSRRETTTVTIRHRAEGG